MTLPLNNHLDRVRLPAEEIFLGEGHKPEIVPLTFICSVPPVRNVRWKEDGSIRYQRYHAPCPTRGQARDEK